ncbi:TPA: helix-turn-helix domain-containing protein [Streptococcus suis]
MDRDSVLAFFPQGRWNERNANGDDITIDVPGMGYFSFDRMTLTEREKLLIELLQNQANTYARSPWQSYFENDGIRPTNFSLLQVLHVHIWSSIDQEGQTAWLDMMKQLLPNLQASYSPESNHHIFILDQSTFLDVREILGDTLATMEFDFGLRMTIFLGQLWPEWLESQWPLLIQAEQDLFRKWCAGHQQSYLLTFSYLYLWSGQSYLQLQSGLRQLISNQQMEAIIEALWEEGAVLTKAAQKLYLHRNTLQYRLDKWQEMTGLQLKDLNDLAICHQAILGMSI